MILDGLDEERMPDAGQGERFERLQRAMRCRGFVGGP